MTEGTERRRLGSTGLHVSALGIGGGSLANLAGEAGIRALVDAAWDAGLRYFDTAAFYAAGESERRFGVGLAGRPRGDFVLSTKLGRFVRDGASAHDYTEAGARASLEGSLGRLRLERADIVFIHDCTPELLGADFERQFATVMEGAYPYLAGLRASGQVGAIGIAMVDAETALRFAHAGDFDCFMAAGVYTLLEHASLDRLMRHCVEHQAGVLVAAPLNSGILATGAIPGARFNYRPATPEMLARTAAIEAVCARHAVSLVAAALQFPLAHPAVASVVAGHQSAAEIAANLALLAEAIPGAFWAELEGLGLLAAGAPVPVPVPVPD